MYSQNHEIKISDIKVVCTNASASESQVLAESRAPSARPGIMPPPGHILRTPHEPAHRPNQRAPYSTRPLHAPPASLPGRNSRLNPDRAALQRCIGHTVYIWLKNGREFWFYPIHIGRTTVAGYAWKRGRWIYTGFSIHSIEFFIRL